jgi:hypothetical protein
VKTAFFDRWFIFLAKTIINDHNKRYLILPVAGSLVAIFPGCVCDERPSNINTQSQSVGSNKETENFFIQKFSLSSHSIWMLLRASNMLSKSYLVFILLLLQILHQTWAQKSRANVKVRKLSCF